MRDWMHKDPSADGSVRDAAMEKKSRELLQQQVKMSIQY
jgi:hypothetical protein